MSAEMMNNNTPPTSGLSTKEVLLQLVAQVNSIDTKVDQARESQIRTETIMSEGRFGERIGKLEEFKSRTEGQLSLAHWAVGGSGIALVMGLVSLYLTLTGQKGP